MEIIAFAVVLYNDKKIIEKQLTKLRLYFII